MFVSSEKSPLLPSPLQTFSAYAVHDTSGDSPAVEIDASTIFRHGLRTKNNDNIIKIAWILVFKCFQVDVLTR